MGRTIVVIALVIGAIILVSGILTSAGNSAWDKPYSETTCADWHERMSDRDRDAMASALLDQVHKSIDFDAPYPSQAKRHAFQAAVDAACSDGLVTDTMDRVYDADPRYGP